MHTKKKYPLARDPYLTQIGFVLITQIQDGSVQIFIVERSLRAQVVPQ